MSLRNCTILFFVAILASCGGGGGGHKASASPGGGTARDPQQADLYYSYPAQGQTGVSPKAPLVLGFMSKITADASYFILTGPDGRVSLSAKSANGGKSVVLTPDQPLDPKSQYTLTTNGLKDGQGNAILSGGLAFTTRPALEGPLSLRETASTFQVQDMSPDGTTLPFLDYSSVNLTLSQPIDPQTVVYGDTVTLEQGGSAVPATVLVDGNSITIDPKNATGDVKTNHDLAPGQPVTVTLTSGVKNIRGDALQAFTKDVTPKSTTPRSVLVQQAQPATQTGTCMSSDTIKSPLTGDPINCVPVIARLLGTSTVSKQQGDVYADLAYAVNFPDVTPLRVPKTSLLNGDALKVLIGGQVDAGFDSGAVTVTFLSDANGYLMPNPYTDDPNAPRKLVLTMDVAFKTEDPRANGAFNQKLLHVKLVGTATTDVANGKLVADAVGVVEPRVLGAEDAYGVLSFHMESYPDQTGRPSRPPVDPNGPTLSSWMPGPDNVDKQRPGDPIILSFSKPLAKNSIDAGNNLTLTDGGTPVAFDWYLDGVDLVIKPKQPLDYNTTYQVQYGDTVTDLAGNGAVPKTLDFTMPTYATSDQQSPVVLTTYPGFPCVTVDMDLASDDAGRCDGGKTDDDHMPLGRMPANRSINITFSQVIKPSTVNASTFSVEQVNSAGTATGSVDGDVEVKGRTLTFTPNEPWQTDAYYRYTLMSATNSDGVNCGGNAICDTRGLPLQTKILAQSPGDAPSATDGGPDLDVYFKGVAAEDGVMQHLRNLPTADVNANFGADDGEPVASDSQDVLKNSAHIVRDPDANDGSTAGSGAVSDANTGCPVGESCPDAKYSFVSGNLDVDLVGFKTAAQAQAMDDGTIPQTVLDNGGVLVYIYPTRIVVSNSTVYADASLGTAEPAPTGPQLMRIRYTCVPGSSSKPCSAPDYGRVKGWIVNGDSGPQFLTNLNLYLDAPKLSPKVDAVVTLTLTHNLHSYPLSLGLAGDVSFLDDGRLQIAQISQNALHLGVILYLAGSKLGTVYVQIPTGGTNLNYVTTPIKN